MGLIDTYQLATSGQNFVDTFTLASNGILLEVIIEDIIETPFNNLGGISVPTSGSYEQTIKKKVTVIATINNIKYTESLMVENKPNLKIEDIEVNVIQDVSKPKIKINIK